MIELPDRFYKWQEFDCFQLAYLMRSQLNRKPLPRFDYVYGLYDEFNFPKTLMKDLLIQNATQCDLEQAELVCFNFDGKYALGTIYQGSAIYIINKPTCQPISRVSHLIDSFWFY